MRVTQYATLVSLMEDGKQTIVPVQTLERFISENCSKWLHETRGEVAFRGMNPLVSIGGAKAFIRSTPSDRSPKDSPPWLHSALADAISHAGLAANRTNSVFCSGNERATAEYGALHVVYMVGDFNYTWSKTVRDAYEDLTQKTERLIYLMGDAIMTSTKPWAKRIRDTIFDGHYSSVQELDDDLAYIVVRAVLETPEALAEVLELRGDDGSLASALKSGHEVLLRGTALYVPIQIYEEYLE